MRWAALKRGEHDQNVPLVTNTIGTLTVTGDH
jgi:hypothetical protein